MGSLDMVDILKAGSCSVGPRLRLRVGLPLPRPLGIELRGHQQTHLPPTDGGGSFMASPASGTLP